MQSGSTTTQPAPKSTWLKEVEHKCAAAHEQSGHRIVDFPVCHPLIFTTHSLTFVQPKAFNPHPLGIFQWSSTLEGRVSFADAYDQLYFLHFVTIPGGNPFRGDLNLNLYDVGDREEKYPVPWQESGDHGHFYLLMPHTTYEVRHHNSSQPQQKISLHYSNGKIKVEITHPVA